MRGRRVSYIIRRRFNLSRPTRCFITERPQHSFVSTVCECYVTSACYVRLLFPDKHLSLLPDRIFAAAAAQRDADTPVAPWRLL